MNTLDERPLSFISFDIEALPGRASQDPVDRLIWGMFDGGEYGIRRISGILKQYGIKGNFLVDFGMCLLYGDKAVKEIVQYLLEQGHEVHVHLHSEWVVRKWGLKSDGWNDGPVEMDQIDGALSKPLLDFAAFKYQALVGQDPMLFRSGSYKFNPATIEAATCVGFKACSNFNSDRHNACWSTTDERAINNEPFYWNDQLLELPVDYSPEPLTYGWDKYENYFYRVQSRKSIKTFNLTLHSWSLLTRGNGDHFTGYVPSHEERLHKICEHLKSHTNPIGYNDFISAKRDIPKISDYQCSLVPGSVNIPTKTCTICGAVYGLALANDICPSCESRARHRQIQDALSRKGNPFAGRTVLACHANPVEKQAFLSKASKIVNFDVRPLGYADLQMDIQAMDKVEDCSFDTFIAVHVLNHVADDRMALTEIHRILKPGGIALITIPCRENSPTESCDNVAEHYGVEALNKYGVGTYRRYGLQDALTLFGELFSVDKESGFDGITGSFEYVFLLKKLDLYNTHQQSQIKQSEHNMSSITPITLSYDEQSRLERAHERAITVDQLMGLRGKRVLEIGCGHGDFCKVLAEEYDCEVVGTEVLAYDGWDKIQHPKLTLTQMDIVKESRFPDNSFDRIVSFVVWEHMRHPWAALKECQRMLRPTGKKYLHAYLYGAPRLSHLSYLIPDPWLHLTHSPKEIMARLGKTELPWHFWCNRLSYLHYLQYFRQLGFYITYENILSETFPLEYYQENEQFLGLYPEHDLKTHGFQVVLVFDESNPKNPIIDAVYSKHPAKGL